MALKKKAKSKAGQKKRNELIAEIDELFAVASAKEKDFDLDIKASTFTAKKGQGGSRQKGDV